MRIREGARDSGKSELGIGQQVTTSHPTGKVSRTWHGATGELAGCPCMYEMSV